MPHLTQPTTDLSRGGATLARYGGYDSATGEFLLTGEPPRKWVNVHYNAPGDHELYAEITNIGDGQITARDRAGNTCVLVSYDHKYLYIRDDETHEAFCPGGAPILRDVADRRTTYHAACTVTRGTALGLRAAQRTFVPADEMFEAWTLTLANLTDRPRRVSVFAFALFALTGKTAEGKPVFKDNSSTIHPEIGGVIVGNRHRLATDRFKGYLVTLGDFAGANGYRDHFTHADFSLSTPRLLRGWDCDNRPGCGPDCAGIVQVRLTLPPHQSRRADFLLGQTSGAKEVRAIRARTTPAGLDAACAAQIARENARAARFWIDTGHAHVDGLVNHFAKKQMVSYLINKSGFRDNLQNDMGLALCDYPLARANLLRALASQQPDGDVPHSFRPLNRLPYADKPCWVLHCIPWIVQESGDLALLDERVPFCDSGTDGTIWEHMVRAMRFLAAHTGAHGLCDQRFADWDDGLEPSEQTGARESVMVTQQFCLGLLELAELAARRGETELAREARALHADFSGRLNAVAWDGEWYARTFTASGYVAGTHTAEEGRIFMYCQPWAVLSRTAPGDRALRCMQAVDRLCEFDAGFSLVEPPYSRFDERIGKKSAMRPYYATNGGCYCHAAGFKAVADCMLGRSEEAWRTVLKVVPDSPWLPLSASQAEPFAFTNCYDRTPENYGRAQYAWRTGTASWFSMVLVEWILGARRHYDGLLVDPCLPRALPRARLTRHFRGAVYHFEIDNTALRSRGVRSLRLDGREISGNLLPDLRHGEHRVEVVV